MTDIQPFGFTVRKRAADDDDTWTGQTWSVSLPHQCDSWDIAGSWYSEQTTRDVAAAELRRFLIEGETALEALERGDEFGDC